MKAKTKTTKKQPKHTKQACSAAGKTLRTLKNSTSGRILSNCKKK